jgi:hypothetical protein
MHFKKTCSKQHGLLGKRREMGFPSAHRIKTKTGNEMNASRLDGQTGVPNEIPFDFAQGKFTRVVALLGVVCPGWHKKGSAKIR